MRRRQTNITSVCICRVCMFLTFHQKKHTAKLLLIRSPTLQKIQDRLHSKILNPSLEKLVKERDRARELEKELKEELRHQAEKTFRLSQLKSSARRELQISANRELESSTHGELESAEHKASRCCAVWP